MDLLFLAPQLPTFCFPIFSYTYPDLIFWTLMGSVSSVVPLKLKKEKNPKMVSHKA